MINTVLTSVALLAMSTAVSATGQAIVVNSCSDPVTLENVPAAGGGHNQVGPESLGPGQRYAQVYTELTNQQGWSIKLYKGSDANNLVQFEYTYHNDGTIWYDLSAVNGDPWNGDWGISSTSGCTPNQAAYRYPTDDAHGMQAGCPDSTSITVTLCSSGGGGAAAGSDTPPTSDAPVLRPSPAGATDAPPAPADTTTPPADTPAPAVDTPVSTPVPPPTDPNQWQGAGGRNDLANNANTVVNVETQVITQTVIVSPSPVNQKRQAHLHRHADHHRR